MPTHPWTETDLTSGTAIVFDATATSSITQAAGEVSSWASKDGTKAAVQSTGSAQPTYSATGLDGTNPALLFSGSQQLLVPEFAQGPEWAVFAVFAPNGSNGAGILGNIVDSDDQYSGERLAQQLRIYYGDAQTIPFNGGAPFSASINTSSSPQIIGINRPTGGVSIQLNGGTPATASAGGTGDTYTTRLSIGARVPGDQAFVGAIAYVGYVPIASLTQDEFDRYVGYLAWKFGLQASLPSGHPYKSAAPTVTTGGGIIVPRRRPLMLISG